MPWKTSDTVDQRMRFIVAHGDGLYSHSELCVRFEISRQTGYNWLDRYAREGVDGLKYRSRAPKVCPHHTWDAALSPRAAVAGPRQPLA